MRNLIVAVFLLTVFTSLYSQKSTNAYSRVEIMQTCTRVDSLNDTTAALYRHNIEGYSNQSSYQQGDTIKLYIATKLSSLSGASATVQILRYNSTGWGTSVITPWSITLTYVSNFTYENGQPIDYKRGANWNLTTSVVAGNWTSGFYCAQITSGSYSGVVPFVIKPSINTAGSTSKILWVVPFNTYQAYNTWGGSGLYWTGQPSAIFQTDTVSFNRPFGEQWDHKNFSGYKYEDSLGQFDLREWAWVQWVENGRYTVEYCTDHDIHQDNIGDFLKKYRTVFIPSHSEYWTDGMRTNISNFIAGNFPNQNAPGNVAFFGANICYWRVTYTDNDRKMIVRKCSEQDLWRNQIDQQSGQQMHEALFIGSEFRPIEQRHAVPQVVTNPTHWIYKNSHLSSTGQVFGSGNATWEPLASGEIDDTLHGFSPNNVQVLARTDANYDSIAHVYSSVTYYINQARNSRVFNGASFGWHGSLFACGDTVGTMVKNILDHFSGLTWADSIVANLTWLSDMRIFAQTDVRQGITLSTSGTRTFIVDSAVSLSVNGTLEINGTTTITGQNNKWGELAIRNGGTLRIKSGATLNLNSPLFFVLETGSNLVIESGGTFNIRTNTSTGNNLTISVPSGAALNVYPPGEIYFGSGTGITANGALNVAGTSNQHITLGAMSGTTPGSWGSIVLSGSGANNSSINYANVQYGTEINLNGVSGVQILNSVITSTINGVNAYNSSGDVEYNSFQTQRDHGIMSNLSSLICNYNTISKSNHSGVALLLTGGSVNYSGTVLANDISGYNWGITSSWGSYSEISDETHTGNRATNCLYGIMSYQSSNLFMNGKWNGYNSIHDNTYYNAYVYSSSSVYANKNYWGWPVNYSKFYCASGSYLDTTSALSTDPWNGQSLAVNNNPPQVNTKLALSKSAGVSISSSDPASQARELRKAGKKNDAMNVLKSELSKKNVSNEILFELYALHEDNTLATEAENNLSAISKTENPLGLYLSAAIAARKGESAIALERMQSLTGTPLEAGGKLAQFYILLYMNNDFAQAKSLFDGLKADKSLEDMDISLAQHALDTYQESNTTKQQFLPKNSNEQVTAVIPSKFELMQNYPNPFNPTTTISYSIAEPNNVKVVVYDYIGREISTLVNEFKSEGRYEASFDARSLASGIYFYRLTSGKNVSTKKMLLLK